MVQSEQQAKQQKRIRKLHEELEKCKDMLQKREIEMIDLKKAMGEQANKNEELNQLKHELIHAKDMLKNKEKNLKEKEIEITKLEEEIYQLSDRTVQMSASLYRIEQSLKESNFVNHRMETGSDIVQNDEEIKGLSSKTDRQSILNWIIMVAIVSNVLQVVLSLVGRYY